MLTLQQLQDRAIDLDVAREANAQSQRRLEDALTTKAEHEQKAIAVIAGYIVLALALFSAFGILADGKNAPIAPAFFFAGALFSIGAALAGWSLLPANYGTLGSDPSVWLAAEVIDGDRRALAATLAYETFFLKERIDASVASNRKKALLLRKSVILGIAAPLILVALIWAWT